MTIQSMMTTNLVTDNNANGTHAERGPDPEETQAIATINADEVDRQRREETK